MDPKRALKTHTALFKTRRAYHVHGYWREKEVWIPRELSRLTRHFLNEEGVSRAWLLAREGSMDPKRALKTHTALFKTRRAYHVHGYWREKEVWIPRELSRFTHGTF